MKRTITTVRHALSGIASFIPGVKRYTPKGTGGTDSARYCYSVWLRHLAMAETNGLNTYPRVVAELGPGDSLGIGLAALISGVDKYFAFDIVEHADTERNLQIFEELVSLFRNRVDVPREDEFPNLKPYLETYKFPRRILMDDRLSRALEDDRIERIKNSIRDRNYHNPVLEYRVPWFDPLVIGERSVDMIYSQAVLEHVDDLSNTYRAMHSWLKPGGYISHMIDFKCHKTADEWNGHWTYSDLTWKLIRGKRSYLLNREPHSTHLKLLLEEGFKVVCDQTIKSKSPITKRSLSGRFRNMSDEDLTTTDAFIQAIKE
ncbi:MAG: methyltransferase domain-containing protein [Acidobacteria bacterium]|nr:methyltransferase domain-containing protein [Acidobacteriota bacterium]